MILVELKLEAQNLYFLIFDSYKKNRHTGSVILIDPNTNATIAAGMII
jgi:sulfate adenylyltransferase subunit 1